MDENIENRLAKARNLQQEAALKKATYEGKLAEIKSRREQIIESFKELGVSTVDEANNKIAQINAELEDIIQQIESKIGSL